MKVPIKGAVVLITGGGGGIGRMMAIECAKRGAKHVLLWGRRQHNIEETAELVRAAGGSADFFVADVSDNDAVEAAGAAVLEKYGRVDILINNAGVVSGAPFLEQTDEKVRQLFEINVLSLYRVTRQFLGGMVERDRGVVVTIASAAGLIGVPRQTDYSASKFAASGFAEALRAELRHQGSKVISLLVQPYYIDTGMFDGVKTRFPLILPILKPEDVTMKTLDAIEAGRYNLVMPPFSYSVKLLKILPAPIMDALADFFGVSSSMDEFVGHQKK